MSADPQLRPTALLWQHPQNDPFRWAKDACMQYNTLASLITNSTPLEQSGLEKLVEVSRSAQSMLRTFHQGVQAEEWTRAQFPEEGEDDQSNVAKNPFTAAEHLVRSLDAAEKTFRTVRDDRVVVDSLIGKMKFKELPERLRHGIASVLQLNKDKGWQVGST